MTRLRREHGSATVELMLLTPVLIALALLVVLAYRVIAAEQAATTAAHAAARAASLQRSPQQAHHAAHAIAAQELDQRHLTCARHDLDVDTGGLQPGSTVRARLTCHASLRGLSGMNVPGSYAARGESAAVVDVYRTTP